MYAIVQIGNSQFKVSEGDTIEAGRLQEEVGKSITLDKVLIYSKDAQTKIGQPYLKDVVVKAKVVDHTQGPKTFAFKYRKRKDSSTKVGGRAKLTALNITQISA
jgi:large subunit ribosomal protein L21